MENHISSEHLSEHITHLFGASYIISSVNRMSGGAQKVVYNIECTNGFICILYVWDITMNNIRTSEGKSLIEQSYGAELFSMNNRYLEQIGVHTPTIYYMNTKREQYPFDYALVQYVKGNDAAYFFEAELQIKNKVFSQINEMLKIMHTNQRGHIGKVNENIHNNKSCQDMIFEYALVQLSLISKQISEIAVNEEHLIYELTRLHSNIKPRHSFGLIHGELGPDHILIDEKLQPYIIDIEGFMFFDIEYEHSFLQFRFGEYYNYFENDNLDSARMLFYRLHHHISLTSGGLKLLNGNFQNKEFAKGLIEYNCEELMGFLK